MLSWAGADKVECRVCGLVATWYQFHRYHALEHRSDARRRLTALRSHAFPPCELCGTYVDDPEAVQTCVGPR